MEHLLKPRPCLHAKKERGKGLSLFLFPLPPWLIPREREREDLLLYKMDKKVFIFFFCLHFSKELKQGKKKQHGEERGLVGWEGWSTEEVLKRFLSPPPPPPPPLPLCLREEGRSSIKFSPLCYSALYCIRGSQPTGRASKVAFLNGSQKVKEKI